MQKHSISLTCWIFTLVAGMLSHSLSADVQLPALFSDHLVLQQGQRIPVWGRATPGEQIQVHFRIQEASAKADENGRWMAWLAPEKAGGPDRLFVRGDNSITLEDVYVGEVWICSGQSNMEWKVHSVVNTEEEVAAAHYPQVRMFTVNKRVDRSPQADCEGEWQVCSPDTVRSFSAVGYFFGRELHRGLDVPIGLIHTSWGGTPAESWTSEATLESDRDFVPILDRFRQAVEDYPARKAEYDAAVERIRSQGQKLPPYHVDPGNSGFEKGWAKKDFDDSPWKSIRLPSYWDTLPDMAFDGAVWFRRMVDIPVAWAGKDLILELGPIDDFDVTYFDGSKVGETGPEVPTYWEHLRRYEIPASLVHSGPSLISVRNFDHFGNGGFSGYSSQMKLSLGDNPAQSMSLAGEWKFHVELSLSPSAITGPGGADLPPEPMGPNHPYSPAGLYNAMLHPLAPYAIRGAIWYQGESNAGRAYQYRKLLAAMIQDWRDLWGQGDFPFGIVQLANFNPVLDEPAESDWAELREAQALTARTLQRTGLAVIIDIGEADDIHPRNKQDVGARLASWALGQIYDREVVSSGPTFSSWTVEGNRAVLSFDYMADGLVIRGGDELKGFSIAGPDREFHWARAMVLDNQIIVWSDQVSRPAAVRYAWANNPVCNLYNSAGLPAVPFRTDNWPGVTLNER